MAIVAAPAYVISISFRDRDGNPGTAQFGTPAAVLLADVTTFVTTTLIPQLVALSDATIVGYTISESGFDAVAPQAPETSDVERKGVFTFRVEGGGVSTVQIPSIKNTLVVDGTNVLNPADPAVIAFIATMVDAGLFDLYGMGNYRGDKLLSLASPAHKTHRKSSKG